MYTLLLSFGIITGLLAYAVFFRIRKGKAKKVRILKNQNDTSEANYAINEHGFLERIHHDKLSRH
jgi:hypothetical protein